MFEDVFEAQKVWSMGPGLFEGRYFYNWNGGGQKWVALVKTLEVVKCG